MEWYNLSTIRSKSYTCGYCGCIVGNDKGYRCYDDATKNSHKEKIYICPRCTRPTYFDNDKVQYPGVKFGNTVSNINKEVVLKLYEEARNSFSVNAFTSVALCCRKLLMNIAVDLGAEENKKFVYYVNWLDENNYILPNAKKWVDQIRKIGNEATHEIYIISKEDAEKSLKFIEMILKLVYEFPAMLNKYMFKFKNSRNRVLFYFTKQTNEVVIWKV